MQRAWRRCSGSLPKAATRRRYSGSACSRTRKIRARQIASIFQGGLSLPDRDYYLVDNKRFQTIRQQYREHMTKMFTLAGDTPEQAAKEADAVMTIETALAKVSTPRVDLRDPAKRYHIYTVADFQKLTPEFDFAGVFQGHQVGPFRHAQRGHARLLQGAERADRLAEPVDAWKIVPAVARDPRRRRPICRRRFGDENFEFFEKTLQRAEGADAALEAVHGADRPGAGRGRGAGLGERALSAQGQGQHGPSWWRRWTRRWPMTSKHCRG